MIKESTLDAEERSERFCYTPQLTEEANIFKKQPFLPFVDINKKTLDELHGISFNPSHLESEEVSKQNFARSTLIKMATLTVKNNKKHLLSNFITVIKRLPSGRKFIAFGKNHDDFNDSRFKLG